MFLPAGHFTQVVWAESTELGVGLATDGNKVFVVGQYRPAGNMNMPGYFNKNVHPKGNIDTKNQVLHNLLSAQKNKYITTQGCNFTCVQLQRENKKH